MESTRASRIVQAAEIGRMFEVGLNAEEVVFCDLCGKKCSPIVYVDERGSDALEGRFYCKDCWEKVE